MNANKTIYFTEEELQSHFGAKVRHTTLKRTVLRYEGEDVGEENEIKIKKTKYTLQSNPADTLEIPGFDGWKILRKTRTKGNRYK
jgi:hypothetical protein